MKGDSRGNFSNESASGRNHGCDGRDTRVYFGQAGSIACPIERAQISSDSKRSFGKENKEYEEKLFLESRNLLKTISYITFLNKK